MSSGADCTFYEPRPGEWYLSLQQWPYGENPGYDLYGPFASFDRAYDYLNDNFQNPGAFCTFDFNKDRMITEEAYQKMKADAKPPKEPNDYLSYKRRY